MFGVLHHGAGAACFACVTPAVVDDHNFKDEPLFYRFRVDDDTYRGAEPGFMQARLLHAPPTR